jgi:DNA-binding NarL/FixJ family response regulator
LKKQLRILLADDNALVLKAVKQMLKSCFQVVDAVSNGNSALKQTAALKPDVVIVDLSMPDLSGLEVSRRLRESHSESKIIFLSISEDPEFVSAAVDTGANGYVFKSRMYTDLPAAIDAAQLDKTFISEAHCS